MPFYKIPAGWAAIYLNNWLKFHLVAGVHSWKVFVCGLPFNILEKINVMLIFHNGHVGECCTVSIAAIERSCFY